MPSFYSSFSEFRYINVIQCTSGIVLQEQNDGILLYPNPGTGLFRLVFSNEEYTSGQISLYDMLGKTIKSAVQRNTNSSFTIDLRAEPAGIYFLQVTKGSKVVTKRLLLQK